MANQKLKMLYILELLSRESDEEHPIDAEQIMQYLQDRGMHCERKSVYSDVAVLKEYGYDILYTKAAKSGYFLASREFEAAEVRLLCDAVQAANFISPKKSGQLTEKILGLLSCWQAGEIKGQVHVENRPKSTNEEIYYHIDKLNRAIQTGCKITVRYRRRVITDSNAVEYESREHTLSPYALIWKDDHYYLVGNNDKYDNLMSLRVDRIRELTVLDDKPVRHFSEVSPYKDYFDSADYAKTHFHMFSGMPEHIELLCRNELIEPVLDRFGETVQIRRAGEEKFYLRADAAVSEGLASWIMQFGAKIQVKSPDSLKAMVLEKAKEICSVYCI